MNSETDLLKLYFGDDFVINKYITVHHPKLNDVINFGEKRYFSNVHTLCSIPSDMKPQLWDMGICWEDIGDFELFALLVQNFTPEQTGIFFGDLDFTKFSLATNNENQQLILHQLLPSGERIVIDEAIYNLMISVLRKIHNIVPKVEHAATKTVQRILIEDDRRRLEQLKNEGSQSTTLQTLVSSLINSSEFKYGLNEVREMPFYAFIDSVNRIQIIKSTTALLNGCYSGMIDSSKLNKNEDLNWMREIKDSRD